MAPYEVEWNVKPGLSQRYRMLQLPLSAGAQCSAKEYVQFLQDQERKVGPDGFLDSRRFTNGYVIRSGATRSKSLSFLSGVQPKTAVDLSVKQARDLEDHEHRLRTIDNAMWQHKQEERVLSRAQGDVLKRQRVLKKMVRDCETVVQRKIFDEEKRMKELKRQQESAKQQFFQTREQVTRSNLLQSRLDMQSERDQGQKSIRTLTRLELRYGQMFLEMKKRHAEIARLHKEYEEKLKRKENEEFALKRQLSELAAAVSLEAQSSREAKSQMKRALDLKKGQRLIEDEHQQIEFVNKQFQLEKEMKDLEAERGALSRDLPATRNFLNENTAKESRHILELAHQLEQNVTSQRKMAEEYSILQSRRSQKRPEVGDMGQQQQCSVTARAPSLSATKTPLSIEHEERRKTLAESIQHLQKSVSNATDAEKLLFKNMRTAETATEKQEKIVARLRDSLSTLQKENAAHVQTSLSRMNRKEQELMWRLMREQAELRKYQSQKEDNYGKLVRHRATLKEEQHLLRQIEKEHTHIVKVTERNHAELCPGAGS